MDSFQVRAEQSSRRSLEDMILPINRDVAPVLAGPDRLKAEFHTRPLRFIAQIHVQSFEVFHESDSDFEHRPPNDSSFGVL